MEHSDIAKAFKALGHPQRLALFEMVYKMSTEGETCVPAPKGKQATCCEPVRKAFTAACGCLGLARSTVSHHFKELQNAGLITCTRDGQAYLCQVNEEVINSIRAFLK